MSARDQRAAAIQATHAIHVFWSVVDIYREEAARPRCAAILRSPIAACPRACAAVVLLPLLPLLLLLPMLLLTLLLLLRIPRSHDAVAGAYGRKVGQERRPLPGLQRQQQLILEGPAAAASTASTVPAATAATAARPRRRPRCDARPPEQEPGRRHLLSSEPPPVELLQPRQQEGHERPWVDAPRCSGGHEGVVGQPEHGEVGDPR
jgi:hypothetical protein